MFCGPFCQKGPRNRSHENGPRCGHFCSFFVPQAKPQKAGKLCHATGLRLVATSTKVMRTQLVWAELSPPTAGSAVLLMTKLMRAEQRLPLPKAGSNATKQDCDVLLHEMKFDHQDQTQACCPPMPGSRHHINCPICGRVAFLTL